MMLRKKHCSHHFHLTILLFFFFLFLSSSDAFSPIKLKKPLITYHKSFIPTIHTVASPPIERRKFFSQLINFCRSIFNRKQPHITAYTNKDSLAPLTYNPSVSSTSNILPLSPSKEEVTELLKFSVLDEGEEEDVFAQKTRPPLIARIAEFVLTQIITQKSEFIQGLSMKVISPTNRQIMRGKVQYLEMKFDQIHTFNGDLWVTGGGRLLIQGLDLRMRRFLFQNKQSLRAPYRIFGDLLLTQNDIINSPMIRSMIQQISTTILENVLSSTFGWNGSSSSSSSGNGNSNSNNILSIVIGKVLIRSRRIVVQGEVSMGLVSMGLGIDDAATIIAFEVSTGAGVRNDGQVVYLKDIQVTLNPDSTLRTNVPLLLSMPIDVDIGDHFRIQNLVIANTKVWIRAASIISPPSTLKQSDKGRVINIVSSQGEEKKLAMYKYDLSVLLSKIMRLNGGMAKRLFQSWVN